MSPPSSIPTTSHDPNKEEEMKEEESPPKMIQIGSPKNFWLYNPSTSIFDLTHPETPPTTSPHLPTRSLALQTTTSPISISPAKSALVIIDMQNFFLSPDLGHSTSGAGHVALRNLVEFAIPACRKAGMQVVWLNWGLTDKEVEEMPPAALRAFGFEGRDRSGKEKKGGRYVGLGNEMGVFPSSETGKEVDAGKMLMRDQWNTALCPPLDSLYEQGKRLGIKPDVWIHKNRMSGLWGKSSPCEEFLEKEGIKTILFAGVNTDQCVGGTLQDAWSKGYDCILVKDGVGTSTPDFAQRCWEFNAEGSLGFVVDCKGIVEGVEGMK